MPGVIEQIHGSVLQHGHFNNRVYLRQLNPGALSHIVPALDALAKKRDARKSSPKLRLMPGGRSRPPWIKS
jgi:hypothetical protein